MQVANRRGEEGRGPFLPTGCQEGNFEKFTGGRGRKLLLHFVGVR